MNTITVKCDECGASFEKLEKEATRSKKLGRKNFCNLTCSVTYRNKHMSIENRKICGETIRKYAYKRTSDELSPFREIFRRIKMRIHEKNKKYETNIDISYLKELWNAQKGICPYTGIKMILPKNTSNVDTIRSLKKASLDRIDSSEGYVKGNIEFVCYAINMAKNSFTRDEMKEFLTEMVEMRGVEPRC